MSRVLMPFLPKFSAVCIARRHEKKVACRNGTVGNSIVTLRVGMDYVSITSPLSMT